MVAELADMKSQLQLVVDALRDSRRRTTDLEAQVQQGVAAGTAVGPPPWQALLDALTSRRNNDVADSRRFQKLTKFDPSSKDEWKDWLEEVGADSVDFVQCPLGARAEKPSTIVSKRFSWGGLPTSCPHEKRWWRTPPTGRWSWGAHPPMRGKFESVKAED